MNTKTLVIIIVVLVVAVVGIYAVIALSSKSGTPTTTGTTDTNGTTTGGTTQTAGQTTTIQGMKVETLKDGTGEGAKAGDTVTVHYVLTLTNGTELDSSVKRNAPFTFTLGQNRVIKGWELGVLGMKIGELRKLTIPPELAYGAKGVPPAIPANATLIYTVQRLK